MNAIMNEIHIWYCDMCDETINIKSNENILIPILMNTKTNMNLLNQKLME